MDYFESAGGVLITWNRVKTELKLHGHIENSIEWIEADRLFNTGKMINAQKLLEWLGY